MTTRLQKMAARAASAGAMLYALPVLAQSGEFDDKFGISHADGLGLGNNDLRDTAIDIVNILLGFLGVIAVIIILWGGFRWMTAGVNEEKVGEAKKMTVTGIIGMVIILASFAIATVVIEQVGSATGAEVDGTTGG